LLESVARFLEVTDVVALKVVYKDDTISSTFMPARISIYLIRHGESEANLNKIGQCHQGGPSC